MRSAIVGSRTIGALSSSDDAISVETDLDALVENLAVEAETIADDKVEQELRTELRASLQKWPVDTGQSRGRISLASGSFRKGRPWVAASMAEYSYFIRTKGHGTELAGGAKILGERVAIVRFYIPMKEAGERGLKAVADEVTRRGGGGR